MCGRVKQCSGLLLALVTFLVTSSRAEHTLTGENSINSTMFDVEVVTNHFVSKFKFRLFQLSLYASSQLSCGFLQELKTESNVVVTYREVCYQRLRDWNRNTPCEQWNLCYCLGGVDWVLE